MSRKIFDPENLIKMREEAGFTQEELASRLGCSRETVNYIENRKQGTIKKLEIPLVNKWWSVCRLKVSENSRLEFVQTLIDYFNIEEVLKNKYKK
jgi:DNA-binding XRE family transcriptional regulator